MVGLLFLKLPNLGDLYFNAYKVYCQLNQTKTLMNKPFCLLLLLQLIGVFFVSAQPTTALSGKYNRISISYLSLPETENYRVFSADKPEFHLPEKFDYNPLGQHKLITNNLTGETAADAVEILQSMQKQQVGQQLMAYLFNRQATGSMDLELLMERGINNANRTNYEEAKALKRDIAYLQDMGLGLMNNAYLLVMEVKKVSRSEDDPNRISVNKLLDSEEVGFIVNGKAYLFKIDFDQAKMDAFFTDIYVDDLNAPQAKEKIARWSGFNPPLALAKSIDFTAIHHNTEMKGKSESVKNQVRKALLANLSVEVSKEALRVLSLEMDALAVQDQLVKTFPLASNIGRKEGLSLGDRYFVYENFLKNDGSTGSRQVGVVRVTRVGENRQENSNSTSLFRQVHGKSLKTGMTLREKNDNGIGIALGYHIGESNLAFLRAEIPIAGYFTRMYAEGAIGFETARLGGSFPSLAVQGMHDLDPDFADLQDYFIWRLAVGLQYDIHFARNFYISPLAGFGYENASLASLTKTESFSTDGIFVQAGISLGMALSPALHVFTRANLNMFLLDTTFEYDEESYEAEDVLLYYDDMFEARQSLINFGAGIRLIL